MARSSKSAETKKQNEYDFDMLNQWMANGIIQKVLSTSDKLNTYKVDVPTKTPKGNIAHAYILVKEFSSEAPFEPGTKVTITGNISTGSYQAKDGTTKYNQDLIAESIKELG